METDGVIDTTSFEKQLSDIIEEYASARARSKYDDCSDVLDDRDAMALVSRCIAAIRRISGNDSTYTEDAQRILGTNDHLLGHLALLVGVVKALNDDLRSGYLMTVEEFTRADVFSDFLEMADYLVGKGYKDAGAVLAGSTLEAHLRKVAGKLGIAVSTAKGSKPAATLNAEIAKKKVYSKLDEKNVTAWLHLRNSAAHGKYDEYEVSQVVALIMGIRVFLARNPA